MAESLSCSCALCQAENAIDICQKIVNETDSLRCDFIWESNEINEQLLQSLLSERLKVQEREKTIEHLRQQLASVNETRIKKVKLNVKTFEKDLKDLDMQINEEKQQIERIRAERETLEMTQNAVVPEATTQSVYSQTEIPYYQQVKEWTNSLCEHERAIAELEEQLASMNETHNKEVMTLKSEHCFEMTRLGSLCKEQQVENAQLKELLSDQESQIRAAIDSENERQLKELAEKAVQTATRSATASVCCQTEDTSHQQVLELTTSLYERERAIAELEEQLASMNETHNREVMKLKSEHCFEMTRLGSLCKEQQVENAQLKELLSDQESQIRAAIDLENERQLKELAEKAVQTATRGATASVCCQTEDSSHQTQYQEAIAENSKLIEEISMLQTTNTKQCNLRKRKLEQIMAQISILRRQQLSLKLDTEEHFECIWNDLMESMREIFTNELFQIISVEKVRDLEWNNCKLEENIKLQIEANEELEAKLVKTEEDLQLTQQERSNLSLKICDLENSRKNLQDKTESLFAKAGELEAANLEHECKEKLLTEQINKDLSKHRSEVIKFEDQMKEKTLLLLKKDKIIHELQQQLQDCEEQSILTIAEDRSCSASVAEFYTSSPVNIHYGSSSKDQTETNTVTVPEQHFVSSDTHKLKNTHQETSPMAEHGALNSDLGFESLLDSLGFVEVDETLIEANADQPAQANSFLQLSTNGFASNQSVQNISHLEDRQEHLGGRSEPLTVVRDVSTQITCSYDQENDINVSEEEDVPESQSIFRTILGSLATPVSAALPYIGSAALSVFVGYVTGTQAMSLGAPMFGCYAPPGGFLGPGGHVPF